MAKFSSIKQFDSINPLNEAKVADLVHSMINKGWSGAPILFCNVGLVTGSHRLAALEHIEANEDVEWLYEADIAEDVTEIINDYCEQNQCNFCDIDFSSLGDIFAGTHIEQYKDEIEEW